MKKHKKVTFTQTEKTILTMDIEMLMKSVEEGRVTKSSIIKDCLIKSFGLFEEELKKYGKDTFKNILKKYPNTKPKTYTLPIEVVERLDYYSQNLGIKKSHLVMISIEVGLNGK